MATPTEFWFWKMRSATTGKVGKSPCRFTEAEALKRDPEAVRVPGSCQVIMVADTADEAAARAPTISTGATRVGR